MILAGDRSARVGRLASNETHLGDPFGLDSCRFDSGERLLALSSDYQLFVASSSFRCSNRLCTTWHSPSSSLRWAKVYQIASS